MSNVSVYGLMGGRWGVGWWSKENEFHRDTFVYRSAACSFAYFLYRWAE